jgi:hypothetical protein
MSPEQSAQQFWRQLQDARHEIAKLKKELDALSRINLKLVERLGALEKQVMPKEVRRVSH